MDDPPTNPAENQDLSAGHCRPLPPEVARAYALREAIETLSVTFGHLVELGCIDAACLVSFANTLLRRELAADDYELQVGFVEDVLRRHGGLQ